jgi:hypothetical protein
MSSPHSTRPLAIYKVVLGSASASTGALSPSSGFHAAFSSSCNFRAALSSLCGLSAILSTGVCRDWTTCICQVNLRITGYIASDIVPSGYRGSLSVALTCHFRPRINHSEYSVHQPKRLQHIVFVHPGWVYSREVLGRNDNYLRLDHWKSLSGLQCFGRIVSSSE